MNRRTMLKTAFVAGVAVSLPVTRRTFAQDASPVPTPNIMNVRWDLQTMELANGDVFTSDKAGRYTLQFLPGGRAFAQFDCNMGSGEYTIDGTSLTMGPFMSTLMGCPDDSFASQYGAALENAATFSVVTDASDSLVIALKADGGTLTFAPSLGGVTWQWTEFQSMDGSVITAADPTRYTIAFADDGTATVVADCNNGRADVKVDGSSIDLTVATTKMACPDDSQANDFLRVLDEAVSWVIRDGKLALALPADSGIGMFDAIPPSDGSDDGAATPEAMG